MLSYQLAVDYNVSLDLEGPGIFYFARYNQWHGRPSHYEVDGTDHLVREASTADPLRPVSNSVSLFPTPLTVRGLAWSEMRYTAYSFVMPRFGR